MIVIKHIEVDDAIHPLNYWRQVYIFSVGKKRAINSQMYNVSPRLVELRKLRFFAKQKIF